MPRSSTKHPFSKREGLQAITLHHLIEKHNELNLNTKEIINSIHETNADVRQASSNPSSSLDISLELERIRSELNVLRRLQYQDRHYQASINHMFEKLHNTSQEIYKDFRDSINAIKVKR